MIFEKAYSQGHMRRRDFMSFVGATAVWPAAAHAQQLEDYVHNEGHIMVSVALNGFFSAAVAISGVYAVLKIGIQS
jgi:succinate dehydrogenase hydrophobic anchor subunit